MPKDVSRRRKADLAFLLSLGIDITRDKRIWEFTSPTLGEWNFQYDYHDAIVVVDRIDTVCFQQRREVLLSDNQGRSLLGETEELEQYLLKHVYAFIDEEMNLLGNLAKEATR